MPLRSPKALLHEYQLSPKHSFGQNFLSDPRLTERIAETAVPVPGGTVVEIGAGMGALTGPLLARAERVIAIERDRDLLPVLSGEFAPELAANKLRLVEGDAKTVDYRELLADGPAPAVLAGNLPYQITGPLLRRATELASHLTRAVFLVQLEVADRLAALPGSDAYGGLSVFAQARFVVERSFVIRRGAFYPQPNVDSAVVLLKPLETAVSLETPTFVALVHEAFQQRRKKLRNAWSQRTEGDMPRLAAAAERAGIDLDLRGETLDVTQFAAMARALEEQNA